MSKIKKRTYWAIVNADQNLIFALKPQIYETRYDARLEIRAHKDFYSDCSLQKIKIIIVK